MTEKTCKDCGRPLTENEKEYCPHCTAKHAGEHGKWGGIIGTIGGTVVAVASVAIAIIGIMGKSKE